MRGKNRIALSGAAGVMGVAAALFAASPAQAYVSDCSAGIRSDGWAYARCSSGTGSYRVLVDCANVSGVRTVGGNWITRTAGTDVIYESYAGCGSAYPSNARVDAR